MKNSTKIIISVICVIAVSVICVIAVLVIIGVIGIVSIFSIALKDDGVYTIGNDTVTSINGVLDNKKVVSGSTSTENGVKVIQKTYQTDGNVKEELLKYANYLIENEEFLVVTDENGNLEMAKESSDNSEIIYITIEYGTSNEYTVTIKKGQGTLTKY